MRIREVKKGVFEAPSFSGPALYEVNPERRTCTCPRFEFHGNCVKHLATVDAFIWADQFSSFNEEYGETLWELLKRIYAPPSRKETSVDTRNLCTEVDFFHYASPALSEAARRRHVLTLFKGVA